MTIIESVNPSRLELWFNGNDLSQVHDPYSRCIEATLLYGSVEVEGGIAYGFVPEAECPPLSRNKKPGSQVLKGIERIVCIGVGSA